MALHRMRNGVKIPLSAEEEKAMRAEWAANEVKHAEQEKAQLERDMQRKALCTKLGLTDDEYELLMGR